MSKDGQFVSGKWAVLAVAIPVLLWGSMRLFAPEFLFNLITGDDKTTKERVAGRIEPDSDFKWKWQLGDQFKYSLKIERGSGQGNSQLVSAIVTQLITRLDDAGGRTHAFAVLWDEVGGLPKHLIEPVFFCWNTALDGSGGDVISTRARFPKQFNKVISTFLTGFRYQRPRENEGPKWSRQESWLGMLREFVYEKHISSDNEKAYWEKAYEMAGMGAMKVKGTIDPVREKLESIMAVGGYRENKETAQFRMELNLEEVEHLTKDDWQASQMDCDYLKKAGEQFDLVEMQWK